MVQPSFPHVIAACARPIAFGPKELAPYASPAFLRDLTEAGAAPACSVGEDDCPITLRMAPGSDTITVEGALRQNKGCCAYALDARTSQVLTWRLSGPAARETLRYPDGNVDGPGISRRIRLPATGTYVFGVSPNLMAEGAFGPFTLTITIR